MRVRTRFIISVVAGLAWAGFSTWIALTWIDDLSRSITPVGAWALVLGIAIIPGYLNVQLVATVMFDRPKPLHFDHDFPDITLLVAAYNEETCIRETLEYALRQDYPGGLVVTVIDDGSTDRTREIVREVSAGDGRLKLVRADHAGKAQALNRGLRGVATPLVATIDADTLLMPWALRRVVARMLESPEDAVAVAGSVMARNARDNLLTRLQQWDYLVGIASVKRAQSLLQGTLVAQGAFSVFHARAVRDAGGWPDTIGEDIVLTWAFLRQTRRHRRVRGVHALLPAHHVAGGTVGLSRRDPSPPQGVVVPSRTLHRRQITGEGRSAACRRGRGRVGGHPEAGCRRSCRPYACDGYECRGWHVQHGQVLLAASAGGTLRGRPSGGTEFGSVVVSLRFSRS